MANARYANHTHLKTFTVLLQTVTLLTLAPSYVFHWLVYAYFIVNLCFFKLLLLWVESNLVPRFYLSSGGSNFILVCGCVVAGAAGATVVTVEALRETLAVHFEALWFRTFADNIIIRTFLPKLYLLHFLHQLLLLLQCLLPFASRLPCLLNLRVRLILFIDLLLLSLRSID